MVDLYCRSLEVAIIVFAASSRKSYDSVQQFFDMITQRRKDVVFIAVGVEVFNDKPHAVSAEEARTHFESMDPPVHYMEASIVSGVGVKEILEYGLREWYERNPDKNQNSEHDKKKCVIC